ncbi:MAG: methyl-accepting chemotaxis protein [Vampirovibrionales bacterium]
MRGLTQQPKESLALLASLCQYGIQYMKRKSYKERFILIALTVMLPAAIVVSTLGSHIYSQTMMIQKEGQAVGCIKRLYHMMEHLKAEDTPALTAESEDILQDYQKLSWLKEADNGTRLLAKQLQQLGKEPKSNNQSLFFNEAQKQKLMGQLAQGAIVTADAAGLMNDPSLDVSYLALTLRRIIQIVTLSQDLIVETHQLTSSSNETKGIFLKEYLESWGMLQDKLLTVEGNTNKLLKRASNNNASVGKLKYQELQQASQMLQTNWDKNHQLIQDTIDIQQGYLTSEQAKTIEKALNAAVSDLEPVFELCSELLLNAIDGRWWDAVGASVIALSAAVGKNIMVIFWLLCMYLILEQSIRHIQAKMNDVGSGNLTVRLTAQADDELTQITHAINAMVESFSIMVSALKQDILSLKHQAHIMIEASQSIQTQAASSTQVSVQAIDKLQQVANDGTTLDKNNQEIVQSMAGVNENVQTVNQASEELQHSIHTIASSLEEMTAVLGEISQHTSKAVQVSDQVKVTAKQTQGTIISLESAANKISQVVDVIKTIASQTSLLALNATIEAANSGEAGHGFAVVATEVKGLATKASQATDDIRSMVVDIQQTAKQSITALTHFDDIVATMNDLNQAIAAAVEEQTAAMHEISSSMQQASSTTERMNESIHHTAESADTVTQQAKITSEKLASMTLALKLLVRPSQRLLMQCAEEEQALYLETNMEKVENASKDTLKQVQKVIETSEELKGRTEHLATMAEQFQT